MANKDKEQEVVETAENTAEEVAEVADDKMAELEKLAQ